MVDHKPPFASVQTSVSTSLNVDPIEKKILAMMLKLPLLPKPIGSYLPVTQSGHLTFVSGQLPLVDNHLGVYKGRLGREVTIEAGSRAARQCTLNALAYIKNSFGKLDKIKRVVRVGGFIAGMPGFADQAKVLNGASDLLIELFGESGKHVRTAVGVTDLPLGACVEVEYLFEMKV